MSAVDRRQSDGDHSPVADADDDTLSRVELKRRARAGVFFLGTRGLLILLLGFAGNVIVARLLAPRDFGVIAVGMSIVLFSGLISDGGLGAGLIRRADPPTEDELRALSAFQLGVTSVATVVAVAVAIPFGRTGWVTAIMVASMPFVALQFPGRILLERSLLYQRLALAELTQVACFQAWSIGTVMAGLSVWGLATATVVRAAAGAMVMACVCPDGLVRPRFSIRPIRALLGFGLRFQAVNAIWIVSEQTLNLSIAAIGGPAALGLWALTRRLMEVPYVIFTSLWRVSFPTMSKLIAAKQEVGPLVERAVGLAVVGTGFVLVSMAAGAPGLVPGLFGEQWRTVSPILPWACLALAVGGSVSVATQGYLFAIGDVNTVLRSQLLQAAAWFAVTLPLLRVIGVVSASVGWTVAAAVEAVVLGRATTQRIQARLLQQLLVPVAGGLCAAAIGWVITVRTGSDLSAGVLGGASAAMLFAVGMALMHRQLLVEIGRFVCGSVRVAVSRRQSAADR